MVDIPEADGETILTVVNTGKPTMPFADVLREPLSDITMQAVRYVNTSDKIKPWVDWSYEDPDKFDFDSDKAEWPVYRDWTAEAAHLSQAIVRSRIQMMKEEE